MDKSNFTDAQQALWERAARGVLQFVADAGGTAPLSRMHDHSERTYFIGHQSFSGLMEELVGGNLLQFDTRTQTATLTDAGRARLG